MYGRLNLIPNETKFFRLTYLRESHTQRKYDRHCFFRCDCGQEVVKLAYDVKAGQVKSCGCLARECGRRNIKYAIAGAKTHGLSNKTPAYYSWVGMRRRVNNPKDKKYHRYGGRGITVCDRWLGRDGFANFLADMGDRPKGLTIDRIDNDGNYEPSNCRWVTPAENSRTRTTVGNAQIQGVQRDNH